MIIFSCSALHSAVNFSQVTGLALWMPNCPVAMLRPPPQVKGGVTEDDILSFLPDVNSTCRVLMTLEMLVCLPLQVPLCHYNEAIFADGAHRRLVEEVQAQLAAISKDIVKRNSRLELPYPYLCPSHIENSVASDLIRQQQLLITGVKIHQTIIITIN
uniref:Lipoxygenase domain-containing protein n=1 Tax=Amphiprion percula TaxID=161767 RepID=A0A3P8SF63_AMPPE